MNRRHASAAAIVAGLALVPAIAAMAGLAANHAASPFQLVFEGTHERVPFSERFEPGLRHTGRFTSGAPFCDSGTAVDLALYGDRLTQESVRLHECDDGSGSLTIRILNSQNEHFAPFTGSWVVAAGTGRYAEVRGRGTMSGELLTGDFDPLTMTFRSTLRGVAAADTTGPQASFSSVLVKRLRQPASTYSLRLVLAVRDDDPGNTVTYALRISGGGRVLAEVTGETAMGSVSLTRRLRPGANARSVRLELKVADPLGNATPTRRVVRLPR